MPGRATAQSFLPATFQIGTFLAPQPARRHRRTLRPSVGTPIGLSPLAVPGTPGQLAIRTLYTPVSVRARSGWWRRRPRSYALFPPQVVIGSSLPVSRSPSTPAALGGLITHPAPVLIRSPQWRFIVCYLDPTATAANGWLGTSGRNGATLTSLDRIAVARTIEFELDAPSQAQGAVDPDNPSVYLRADASHGYDGEPYLNEGNRFLFGFRREGGYDPDTGAYAPWVIRFAGILMQVQDIQTPGGHASTTDQAKSTYTAFDPWMELYNRPVVKKDGTLLGRDGITSRDADFIPTGQTHATGGDIALELLRRTIQYHGPVWIDAGVPYGGTARYGESGASLGATDPVDVTFQQGCTVGEAWKTLCDTSTMDIALRPIYDPVNRPGFCSELAIHRQLGQTRYNAIMAWDVAPRSLLGINRLEDGTQRVNIAQFFTQGGIPVPTVAADGIAPITVVTPPGKTSQAIFGEYWGMKTLTGQTALDAAASVIYALMLATVRVRRFRATSITLDPAPGRAAVPLSQYNIGDYVPIYASKRLRKPIPDPAFGNPDGTGQVFPRGRIYRIPIVLDDNGVETVQQLEFSADQIEGIP